MTKKIISLLFAVVLIGCATVPDALITGAVDAGARFGITQVPLAQREAVRNWGYFAASSMRALVNPTPADLQAALLAKIPASVLAAYPEIQNQLIPFIVDQYTTFYNQYSHNAATLTKILNDIALGLEQALAPH